MRRLRAGSRASRAPGRSASNRKLPVWKRVRSFSAKAGQEVQILWLAARDPRTPWLARLAVGSAAGYIFSPVQLIPNFVPLLGQLDDVLVAIVGGWLAVKLIPPELLDEFRWLAEAQVRVRCGNSSAWTKAL